MSLLSARSRLLTGWHRPNTGRWHNDTTMKHSTKFYKNQFKNGDFTYADAIRMVNRNTVRSVNLITPAEKAEQNWQQLKYEDAKRRAEQMYRHDVGLRVQDAIASFIIVFITFAAMAAVIANYSH